MTGKDCQTARRLEQFSQKIKLGDMNDLLNGFKFLFIYRNNPFSSLSSVTLFLKCQPFLC